MSTSIEIMDLDKPVVEHEQVSTTAASAPRTWEQRFLAEDGTEDPTINKQPLEVYLYYAARERSREENDYRPVPDAPWTVWIKKITGDTAAVTPYSPGQRATVTEERASREWMSSWRRNNVPSDARRLSSQASHGGSPLDEAKNMSTELAVRGADGFVTPHERETAYRIMRISSWQVVVYLIFTDMCGWWSAPMAYKTLGFGPSVLVYTFLCLFAFLCGQILWKLYMALDSERYPIKSYGDIADRTYGPIARTLVNTVQFLQLAIQVAAIVALVSRALVDAIAPDFCLVVLNVILAVIGVVFSQVRTLRNVSALTYFNAYWNLGAMVLGMFGAVLYDAVDGGSTRTYKWVPPSTWKEQMAGVQIAIFAYAGATIFVEFMAEMRRPRDFWKSAIAAQGLVFACYMSYGIFVYSIRGQTVTAYPTFTNEAFSTVISIATFLISITFGLLYSHIACKVVYRLLLRKFFGAPSVSSRKSIPWWGLATVLWWLLVWVIASAIPDADLIANIVASVSIIPLSYITPPLLLLGHWIQRDAMEGDRPWRPGMAPYSNRVDTFRNLSRWKRGLKRLWYYKLIIIIFILCSLGLMVTSTYTSVLEAKQKFGHSKARRPFACHSQL